MIKLSNVSKTYGKEKIVDNLSLEITKGSVFGFLGPNGAGKTTTIKMIVGISQPTKGTIEIENKSMAKISSRAKIGFMPEDPYFYDHLTAKEFLEFMASLSASLLKKEGSREDDANSSACRGWIVKDRGRHRNEPHVLNQKINQILILVGLKQAADKSISTFSKGMKQRLGLAQAIISSPDYIFLDEPLDGLDPIGRREFKKIILDLKKQGKTIFFNSHILSDVEEICDQIGIINKGKLIYSGSIKNFSNGKSLEDDFVKVIESTNNRKN